MIAGARGEAHRHVGAGQPRGLDQARIVERKTVAPRQKPQRRGGIRRAAADAGSDRQYLVEDEIAELEVRHAFAEQLRRLEHQIVRCLAAGLRQRPGRRKLQSGPGRQAEAVGAIGERDYAFEVVIAVDAPANHPQRSG